LKQFVRLLVATPKETWNGSKGSSNVAEVLTDFETDILICKKSFNNNISEINHKSIGGETFTFRQ